MSIYSVEFDGEFDVTIKGLMADKQVSISTIFQNALRVYGNVHRTLEEAKIECEPNLPWKLSLMEENGRGGWRVVKDIELP